MSINKILDSYPYYVNWDILILVKILKQYKNAFQSDKQIGSFHRKEIEAWPEIVAGGAELRFRDGLESGQGGKGACSARPVRGSAEPLWSRNFLSGFKGLVSFALQKKERKNRPRVNLIGVQPYAWV